MLSLIPASSDDYPFFYDIEPPAECTYADWLATVTSPQWATYLVHKAGKRVGGLFLECVDAGTVEFHYSVIRKAVKPTESARLLVEVGKSLFDAGVECLQTVIPQSNRAAIRLAQSCGLSLDSLVIRHKQPFLRHVLMRKTYLRHPEVWS